MLRGYSSIEGHSKESASEEGAQEVNPTESQSRLSLLDQSRLFLNDCSTQSSLCLLVSLGGCNKSLCHRLPHELYPSCLGVKCPD